MHRFCISTHSPRVGRTSAVFQFLFSIPQFQLTRPVWGEPLRAGYDYVKQRKFQLTRPVWGEPISRIITPVKRFISTHSPRVGRTVFANSPLSATHNFNSLAPCGANRHRPGVDTRHPDFNSLAPCGANLFEVCHTVMRDKFQLTRPVWGEPIIDITRHLG